MASSGASYEDDRPGSNVPSKRFSYKPSLTEGQKRDLKLAFGEFDPRGVGLIESRNFIVSLRAMGLEPKCSDVYKFINAIIGSRGNEFLDFKDYYHLMSVKMLEDDSKSEVERMFQTFCDEEDGAITLDKLIKISQELEEGISLEELQEMMHFANTSGNGTEVNLEEFIKMMEIPELE